MQLKAKRTSTRKRNLLKVKFHWASFKILPCTSSISKFFRINLKKSKFSSTYLRKEGRRLGLAPLDRLVSNQILLRSLRGLRFRKSMNHSNLAMLHLSKKVVSKIISLRRLFLKLFMLKWLATATRSH